MSTRYLGSAVGHDIGEQRRRDDDDAPVRSLAYTEERCEVR